MSDDSESFTLEDVNKSPKATMKLNLSYPINELIAWAIFGDSTFIEDNAFLYSNYSESRASTLLINKAHIELMNSIEQDVKHCITENSHNVDFSTINSADKGIESVLNSYLPKKYAELTLLITKKNSPFKAPIWWAALVIGYREMALFAFSNGSFYVAMQLNEFCRECQAQMMFKNIAFIKAYQKKLSTRNKIGGDTKWGDIVEQQRRRYLEIDQQHSKKLGKKTTIKHAAEFIYFNHNDFNMGFETIRDHLSAARNGVFTNNRK